MKEILDDVVYHRRIHNTYIIRKRENNKNEKTSIPDNMGFQ